MLAIKEKTSKQTKAIKNQGQKAAQDSNHMRMPEKRQSSLLIPVSGLVAKAHFLFRV